VSDYKFGRVFKSVKDLLNKIQIIRFFKKSLNRGPRFNKEERMTTDYLTKVGDNWESLAKTDPMWAILSDPSKKDNKWDIVEFLATGVKEIEELMNYLATMYGMRGRSFALDFGCGMGRLTLPLSKYFDNVFGLDISETMIRLAEQLKYQHSRLYKGKITYILNKSNFIPFEDNKFELVYSNIVLQHMNKYNSLLYISEFIRVLKKDGFAIFQAPSRCLSESGNKFESPVETCNGIVTIDMNIIPIRFVIDTIYDAGGKLIEIRKDHSAGPKFESFKYFISK
jgi:ubiquinone/menaquinone biosynthesis C-methylase UbiE